MTFQISTSYLLKSYDLVLLTFPSLINWATIVFLRSSGVSPADLMSISVSVAFFSVLACFTGLPPIIDLEMSNFLERLGIWRCSTSTSRSTGWSVAWPKRNCAPELSKRKRSHLVMVVALQQFQQPQLHRTFHKVLVGQATQNTSRTNSHHCNQKLNQ